MGGKAWVLVRPIVYCVVLWPTSEAAIQREATAQQASKTPSIRTGVSTAWKMSKVAVDVVCRYVQVRKRSFSLDSGLGLRWQCCEGVILRPGFSMVPDN